jgi:hypothetical protein
VTARLRAEDGTNFCSKLRRAGRTPGLLFSLPGERHALIEMATTDAAAAVSPQAGGQGRGRPGAGAAGVGEADV